MCVHTKPDSLPRILNFASAYADVKSEDFQSFGLVWFFETGSHSVAQASLEFTGFSFC